jgi:nicotinate dehydrogenase subunit B
VTDVTASTATLPASLARTPRLSRWFTIGADGTVTVRTGKIEFGQGIATAIAQTAAEELDVEFGRIRVVAPTTAESPDEGLTSGSRSVQESGAAVRQAAAEIRAILLAAAAERLGVDVDVLRVEDGEIIAADGPRTSYWALSGPGVLETDATGGASPKSPESYRVVGDSAPRLDIPDKVAGRPRFIHDLALPEQLFGRVIRPPSPAADLTDLDDREVRELPGVVSVVRDGRFLGVVAEGEEAAVQAAGLLAQAATWREGETLPDAAALPAFLRSQPAEDTVIDSQADPSAQSDVARVVSASYSRPFLAHASIAPSCAVARWDGSEVVIWCHSQGIFRLRKAIARALGIGEERVTVHHVESAGCYGHNGADDVAFDAVLLARTQVGHPVKVQWSRADELSWSPFGPAMAIDLQAGLDGGGRIVSWRHEVWSGGHTSRPGYAGTPGLLAAAHAEGGAALVPAADPPAPRGGLTRGALPLYPFRDRLVVAHRVLAMPLRTSALRSLGTHANAFAAECFLDSIAALAGADPVEYRLSYLTDPRARAVVKAVASRSRWGEWRPTEGRGHGIGFARYQSGAYCAVVAEVEVDHEVHVRRLAAAVDVGSVVNPDGVANQIEGGAVQATSWTVLERVTFDRTRVTSTTWESYPIMRFSEVPVVDVEILDRPDEASVGAGEAAAGPTAAAIGNAVADALGIAVRDLPLTPDTIVAAIERHDD